MENNIQRYKGNENIMNYISQNPTLPYQSSQPPIEYNPDECYFSPSPVLNYQNYQSPYRPSRETITPYESNVYDYSYDQNPNPYAYGGQPVMPSYQENYQNFNEPPPTNIPSYEGYYPEQDKNPYMQFNSPTRAHNYPRPDMNSTNYFNEMILQGSGANLHGHGQPGSGMNIPQEQPHYRPRHRSVNHFIRQNLNHNRFSTKADKSNETSETFKHGPFNARKPKPTVSSPNFITLNKSYDSAKAAIDVSESSSLLSNLNFKIKSPNATKLETPKKQTLEDIQMNSKDFPPLCATPKLSQNNSQSQTPSPFLKGKTNEELNPKRPTISASFISQDQSTQPQSQPDVTDFCEHFVPVQKSSQLPKYTLSELGKTYNHKFSMGRSGYNIQCPTINCDSNNLMNSNEQDHPVPFEYLIYQSIREKIAKFDCKIFNDELLFYIYYTENDDLMKMSVIAHLHARKWKYNIKTKIWLKLPTNYSLGDTYTYFDSTRWEYLSTDNPIHIELLENNVYQSYLSYETSVVIAQSNMFSSKASQITFSRSHTPDTSSRIQS